MKKRVIPDSVRFEPVDSTPVSISSGLKKPPTLEETVARIARDYQAKKFLAQQFSIQESDDEAEDFDIPDDPTDPATKFELAADSLPAGEVRRRLIQVIESSPPQTRSAIALLFGKLFRGKRLPNAQPKRAESTGSPVAKPASPPVAEVKP